MARVEFETDNDLSSRQALGDEGLSSMEKMVVKYTGGYVKNKKQANYVLIVFALVVIAVSFLLISNKDGGSVGSPDDIKILPANI